MGSQFLMSILKDSGIDILLFRSLITLSGAKIAKTLKMAKAGLKIARVVLLRRRVCNECGNGDGRG